MKNAGARGAGVSIGCVGGQRTTPIADPTALTERLTKPNGPSLAGGAGGGAGAGSGAATATGAAGAGDGRLATGFVVGFFGFATFARGAGFGAGAASAAAAGGSEAGAAA